LQHRLADAEKGKKKGTAKGGGGNRPGGAGKVKLERRKTSSPASLKPKRGKKKGGSRESLTCREKRYKSAKMASRNKRTGKVAGRPRKEFQKETANGIADEKKQGKGKEEKK